MHRIPDREERTVATRLQLEGDLLWGLQQHPLQNQMNNISKDVHAIVNAHKKNDNKRGNQWRGINYMLTMITKIAFIEGNLTWLWCCGTKSNLISCKVKEQIEFWEELDRLFTQDILVWAPIRPQKFKLYIKKWVNNLYQPWDMDVELMICITKTCHESCQGMHIQG